MKTLTSLLLALGTIASPPLFAHGGPSHEDKASVQPSSTEHAFGREGDPKQINRVIAIDMDDKMRFKPNVIRIKQGETVKFVVRNQGRALHEMVIGTLDTLKEHSAMMKKNPGMEHDEPYMAHVKPKAKKDMIWQFTQPGEFSYACLLPGHMEAGMLGKIIVTKG